MNQPMPATTSRPSGGADAPDIFFVLRRYAWLILGGTALGTAIALGLYWYLRNTSPRYTSSVTFQVLPPAVPPGRMEGGGVEVTVSADEVTRLIRRQTYYILS